MKVMPGALSLLDEVRAPGRVQVVRATPSEPICSAAALAADSNSKSSMMIKTICLSWQDRVIL